MKKLITILLLGCLALSSQAFAKIHTETVDYTSQGKPLQGFLAYDDAKKGAAPGILIVHDWMGLGEFTQDKAIELAKLGFVAFAVDVYGKGVRPANADEAGKFATQYKNNRALLRSRMSAAYATLKAKPQVDAKKIAVMGYCFGGTAALELARSGAPLAGVATFHGGLSTPTPQDAKNITAPVLAMHGADDPFVPPSEVKAFQDEMKNAHVKLTFISYPDAVHAFTNPQAGNDKSKGAAYNAKADKKSWQDFQKFLKTIF
jgi:dienelactone hydrolase